MGCTTKNECGADLLGLATQTLETVHPEVFLFVFLPGRQKKSLAHLRRGWLFGGRKNKHK